MGKLSETIIKETFVINEQRPKLPAGRDLGKAVGRVIGGQVYNYKQKSTRTPEQKREAAEKRAATIKAKQEEHDEKIRLETENRIMKQNQIKAAEDAERKRIRAEKSAATRKANREAADKAAKEQSKRDAENAAKDKEAYKKIVDQNKKHQQKHNEDKMRVKDFEKLPEAKKEKPRSSGLISTATRSLRF